MNNKLTDFFNILDAFHLNVNYTQGDDFAGYWQIYDYINGEIYLFGELSESEILSMTRSEMRKYLSKIADDIEEAESSKDEINKPTKAAKSYKDLEDFGEIDLADLENDVNETRRLRGRMLRESSTAMAVEYVIGRELFDDKWWPIIVYLNQSPNRYWYEAICADEGGVYHTELGKGYLSRIRPGTDKCAPEVVEAVEDEFFGQFAVDDIPTRRVDSIEDLEEHAPAGKQLISRD